jgi:hypothetical protein
MTLREVSADYLESAGTEAYRKRDARALFRRFEKAEVSALRTHRDRLGADVEQWHRGGWLRIDWKVWPVG